MREKTLKLLGLMRRASAIEPGEDRALAALHAGRAKLLLLASDAADNARRRAENLLQGRRAVLIELPFERAELGAALGIGSCAMAAVTDLGFAAALTKLLSELDGARYAAAAETLQARQEKTARRKKETAERKRNGKNSG